MNSIEQKTPKEINMEISRLEAKLRKRMGMSQKKLAEISGVSFGSLKRFEQTGEISLLSLSKISIALGVEESLITVFDKEYYTSIEEVIREQKN